VYCLLAEVGWSSIHWLVHLYLTVVWRAELPVHSNRLTKLISAIHVVHFSVITIRIGIRLVSIRVSLSASRAFKTTNASRVGLIAAAASNKSSTEVLAHAHSTNLVSCVLVGCLPSTRRGRLVHLLLPLALDLTCPVHVLQLDLTLLLEGGMVDETVPDRLYDTFALTVDEYSLN